MKPVSERLSELRAAMKNAGCDAFVMPSSDPHSSEYAPEHFTAWEYFSGFSCENSYLVVTATEAAMWVDGRFFGAADKALNGTGIVSMHMGVKGVPTVHEWIAERIDGKVLGYCAETMPLLKSRSFDELCQQHHAVLKDLPLVDEVWTEDRPALPSTPAWILDVKYAGKSASEKLDIVRNELVLKGATSMLVTKLDSLAWLLNLRAGDVEDTPYALAFCYMDLDKAVLFIDESRVDDSVKTELALAGVKTAGYGEMTSYLAANKDPQIVLIDPDSLNASLYLALTANPAYKILEAADPIAMLKAVKNETEIASTKEAHLHDGVSMCRYQMELEKRLAAGETLRETDIDDILHKYRSANPLFITESFGTIAAWGPNAAMMHYAPKKGADSEIERHGFLLVDSGATYYNGSTDITRTYIVGPLRDEEKMAYTRVLRCHIDTAMAVWQEGMTGGQLDMIARQPLWHHMLDYRCGTGHGVAHVGAIHEGPHRLRTNCDIPFVPGMVVTDEPGLYEEGDLGIRIENELVVTEAGESSYGRYLHFEPLTYVPIELRCVIREELSREEIEWINWYHQQVFEKLSPLMTAEEVEWLRDKTKEI